MNLDGECFLGCGISLRSSQLNNELFPDRRMVSDSLHCIHPDSPKGLQSKDNTLILVYSFRPFYCNTKYNIQNKEMIYLTTNQSCYRS